MGFCTKAEYGRFLHQCPIFERLLVEDGILLRKYWFSVSDDEQERRFRARLEDPMRPPLELPPRPQSTGYVRAPRDSQTFVPDYADALLARR